MLKLLASVGPVVVAVDASEWQSYLGGIIRFHCGQKANNHAVLIVGYDTTGRMNECWRYDHNIKIRRVLMCFMFKPKRSRCELCQVLSELLFQ